MNQTESLTRDMSDCGLTRQLPLNLDVLTTNIDFDDSRPPEKHDSG